MGELGDLRFCHLVVGVTDMDRALSFYRGLLGMDIVFDQLISGESFDAALHASRKQEGRVVGGVIGGLMVELLSLGRSKPPQDAAVAASSASRTCRCRWPISTTPTGGPSRPGTSRTRNPLKSATYECSSSRIRTAPRSSSSSYPAAPAARMKCTGARHDLRR